MYVNSVQPLDCAVVLENHVFSDAIYLLLCCGVLCLLL